MDSPLEQKDSKLMHSRCFFILVCLSNFFSAAGISTSIWLLSQASDATAVGDPKKVPLHLAYLAVGVGSFWYVGIIVLLTIRKSCEKSMCCSGTDLLAYINNYTSGLNAMLALGVQIAYVGAGDFATSVTDFTKIMEICSICCVVADLVFGSLISFLQDWQEKSKNLYQELEPDF